MLKYLQTSHTFCLGKYLILLKIRVLPVYDGFYYSCGIKVILAIYVEYTASLYFIKRYF